jgi:ATP-dependent Clp protease adaptor protein ClpS
MGDVGEREWDGLSPSQEWSHAAGPACGLLPGHFDAAKWLHMDYSDGLMDRGEVSPRRATKDHEGTGCVEARPAVTPYRILAAAATPAATPEIKTVEKTALASVWKVVVLNDPVNLMSYVVLVFKKVFGFNDTKARKHMLEVHEQGRSVVWSGPRDRAETYVYTLQEWHLSAILEQDERH